jgi:hypothetical protein
MLADMNQKSPRAVSQNGPLRQQKSSIVILANPIRRRNVILKKIFCDSITGRLIGADSRFAIAVAGVEAAR